MLDKLGRQAEILLVEDDDDDVFLTMEGFKRSGYPVNINRVENGVECLAYLRKEGRYADVTVPDVILLDLNLPLMDGRELLEAIVADKALQHFPVVILTTSDAEADILLMYKLRCSSYITKPVDFYKFQEAIEEFSNYWFTLAETPS